jgi:hypothetical protein
MLVSERLQKVIDARLPSKSTLISRLENNNSVLFLQSKVSEKQQWNDASCEDLELRNALVDEIKEKFDNGKFQITTKVDDLWMDIKTVVKRNYVFYSKRCAATKRKTTNFIETIDLYDKRLNEYILNLFLSFKPPYFKKSAIEFKTIVDQLDSLRRIYGKK